MGTWITARAFYGGSGMSGGEGVWVSVCVCVCVWERPTHSTGVMLGFLKASGVKTFPQCCYVSVWSFLRSVWFSASADPERERERESCIVRRRQWCIQREMQLPASRQASSPPPPPSQPVMGGPTHRDNNCRIPPYGSTGKVITGTSMPIRSRASAAEASGRGRGGGWWGGSCERILLMLAQSHSSSEWSDPCSLS